MNEPVQSAIVNHPFFAGLRPEHLAIIAGCVSGAAFKPDEVLFREGEPANRFYLLRSGRIALEAHEPANGTALVQHLGAGDALGWSWLFPPYVWHFQARAIEPSTAIVVDGAHLLNAAERNHDFGYELMKRVARVLIQRLQVTRKELLRQQVESILSG